MAHGANTRMETANTTTPGSTIVDADEVARFAALASEWWDPHGKFRPLHKIGPARLTFVRDQIMAHFGLKSGAGRPLRDLKILDIGCGGGLICEPLSRLGGNLTGLDPALASIEAARQHAEGQGLDIAYRSDLAEKLVEEGALFDVVLCLEVVEHVPDVGAFVQACARLVRPGGLMVLSTINRTIKAYALAIVGAEYVLRWLPVGTHQWERFVTPDELRRFVENAGLKVGDTRGLVYNPLADRWSLGRDTDVNYMTAARKPA
jgi:2-polyprenyl-6-hydroxyphenyl methylase/3-demethylubiquinone-9 3-methyltransferase